MIDLIKSLYEQAKAYSDNAKTRLEAESKIMSEASALVVDRPDRDGWIKTFGTNDREKGFVQETHYEMIRKAREFFRFDPNAKAALTTLVNYIMGKGLTITPKADDPLISYIWREFWTSDRNKMSLRQFEIILRALRDGEVFIEFFDEDEDKTKTGKVAIRFIDPLRIKANGVQPTDATKTGSATIDNGVITDPDDTEKVIEYTVQSVKDENVFRTVKADKMHHIKINVDSDQKRGESQLLSVLKMIKDYQQWLENRIILNKMRSAIVLVKKVTGTPTEVSTMAATQPTVRNPSGSTLQKNIRSGTIITAGPGVDYEMMSANLNATDAKEDGRNIKLNIAAGVNIPEYCLGDASNQNYASSLIAESPFVKAIQYWQIFFEYHFGQIYQKVIKAAVDAKVLVEPDDEKFLEELKKLRPDQGPAAPAPLTEAEGFGGQGDAVPTAPTSAGAETSPTAKIVAQGDPEDAAESEREAKLAELMPEGRMETPCEIFYGCDMTWPEIVHRDLKQQVDALSIARQNGWLADSTASSALGYDYTEEVRKQRQIEDEANTTPNPLIGRDPAQIDGQTMDAEMEDTLNELSPEERDQVLKAKDPRDVVKVMGRKKKAVPAGDAE